MADPLNAETAPNDFLPAVLAPVPPLGMGWVQRFVPVQNRTPDMVYARQLYVGVSILATPTFAAGMAVLPWLGAGHLNPILAVNLALVLGGLLAWRLRWASFRTVVHLQLLAWWLAAFSAVLALGGPLTSGASAIWGLVSPILGILLLGRAAGLTWLGLWLAGLAATFTWTLAGLPTGSPLPPVGAGALELNNLVQFGLFSVFAMNWFVEQRELAERAVAAERARSERLLAKGMPRPVLERLRADERVADRLDDVAVLFADVVGFTSLASAMDPRDLLRHLEALFATFDTVIERHGLERVKTIGDCVMAVAGAPTPMPRSAEAMARCALDLRDVLGQGEFAGTKLQLRIGVHHGAVVAGVLGRKRLAWDLWGDTVNLASRMESTGAPGRVHVSDAFRQAVGDAGVFDDRGEIEVKGKGRQRTHWLVAMADAAEAKGAERPEAKAEPGGL